jgi:putative polyhydroxyalkanoate system protein
MAYIHIKHYHLLDRKQSRDRVVQIIEKLSGRYRVKFTWKEYQLFAHHKGCTVSAHLHDHKIELRVKLGILFSPMREQIEKALCSNLVGVFGDKNRVAKQVRLSEKI